MVGAAGFEPTASSPPAKRAAKLRHAPNEKNYSKLLIIDNSGWALIAQMNTDKKIIVNTLHNFSITFFYTMFIEQITERLGNGS